MGLRCSQFLASLRTHTQALRDGRAVGKGTASAGFLLFQEGEMKQEEWIRNVDAEMVTRSITWVHADILRCEIWRVGLS